jgi:hypothetical protein
MLSAAFTVRGPGKSPERRLIGDGRRRMQQVLEGIAIHGIGV